VLDDSTNVRYCRHLVHYGKHDGR